MNLRKRERAGRPKNGDHAKRVRSKPKPTSAPSQSPQDLERVQELKRLRGLPKHPSPPSHWPEDAKTAHELVSMLPQPSPDDVQRVHELLSMHPKLVARARKLQNLGDSDGLELFAQLLPHVHPDAGVDPEKELPGLNLPKVLEWLDGRVRLISLGKRGVEPPTGDARNDPKALCREFEQALEKDNARFEELQRLIAVQTEGGAAAEEQPPLDLRTGEITFKQATAAGVDDSGLYRRTGTAKGREDTGARRLQDSTWAFDREKLRADLRRTGAKGLE